MMKKIYSKPETSVTMLNIESIMQVPVSKVNPGDGKTYDVGYDTTGGNEIDAKHHTAWDTWDE